MVVAASFLQFFIVDGLVYNTGSYNEYLSEFSAQKSRVSWVNSINTGFYFLIGKLDTRSYERVVCCFK